MTTFLRIPFVVMFHVGKIEKSLQRNALFVEMKVLCTIDVLRSSSFGQEKWRHSTKKSFWRNNSGFIANHVLWKNAPSVESSIIYPKTSHTQFVVPKDIGWLFVPHALQSRFEDQHQEIYGTARNTLPFKRRNKEYQENKRTINRRRSRKKQNQNRHQKKKNHHPSWNQNTY